jgi:hypothetical protein
MMVLASAATGTPRDACACRGVCGAWRALVRLVIARQGERLRMQLLHGEDLEDYDPDYGFGLALGRVVTAREGWHGLGQGEARAERVCNHMRAVYGGSDAAPLPWEDEYADGSAIARILAMPDVGAGDACACIPADVGGTVRELVDAFLGDGSRCHALCFALDGLSWHYCKDIDALHLEEGYVCTRNGCPIGAWHRMHRHGASDGDVAVVADRIGPNGAMAALLAGPAGDAACEAAFNHAIVHLSMRNMEVDPYVWAGVRRFLIDSLPNCHRGRSAHLGRAVQAGDVARVRRLLLVVKPPAEADPHAFRTFHACMHTPHFPRPYKYAVCRMDFATLASAAAHPELGRELVHALLVASGALDPEQYNDPSVPGRNLKDACVEGGASPDHKLDIVDMLARAGVPKGHLPEASIQGHLGVLYAAYTHPIVSPSGIEYRPCKTDERNLDWRVTGR